MSAGATPERQRVEKARQSRTAALAAARLRAEAAALEERAAMLIRTAAVTQAEAIRLYTQAAILRREAR